MSEESFRVGQGPEITIVMHLLRVYVKTKKET